MSRRIFFLVLWFCFASCVSNKKYQEGQDKLKKTQDLLSSTTMKLNDCLMEKEAIDAKYEELSKNNKAILSNFDNVAQLNQKSAVNMEKIIESLHQRDATIKKLNQLLNQRDSLNGAMLRSIKGVLVNTTDEEVSVALEKGMVYVSIADNLLFSSGSYVVGDKAHALLQKVAEVLKNKPDFDVMVEGHTDNVAIKTASVKDNWDLSVLRATAVVRLLQQDFNIDPHRIIAAGRGEYLPLNDNQTAQKRALNRRTRMIIMPKMDKFFSVLEQELKKG